MLKDRLCRVWGFPKGPKKEPQELLQKPQPMGPSPINPSSANAIMLAREPYTITFADRFAAKNSVNTTKLPTLLTSHKGI